MHHDALGKKQYPLGLGKVKHVETIEQMCGKQFPRRGVPMFSTYQAVNNIQYRVANTHCIVTVGPVSFFGSKG
jgi:hypothetical protein